MFNQYNELSNYMTYDSSSLNQYNYKNMDDVFPVYQQYQNLYYFTKQINPITLSNVNAQSLKHEIPLIYHVIYDLQFMMALMEYMVKIQ